MEDTDFQMLDFFVRHKNVKQHFYIDYISEIDRYGLTVKGVVDSYNRLEAAQYIQKTTINNEPRLLITDLGKKIYISEKQNRDKENRTQELRIEKLEHEVSINRKTKHIWWLPYFVSIISVLIAGGSLFIATNAYKLSEKQQKQSVTKEEMQTKIEESKQNVLRYVDSLYQKAPGKKVLKKK